MSLYLNLLLMTQEEFALTSLRLRSLSPEKKFEYFGVNKNVWAKTFVLTRTCIPSGARLRAPEAFGVFMAKYVFS